MKTTTTILNQLGGNRFRAMTGAKNFVSGKDGMELTFKIGRGAHKSINFVGIEYVPGLDLYKVRFCRLRRIKGEYVLKTINESEGIYADQLQTLFTEVTGLYTSMGF